MKRAIILGLAALGLAACGGESSNDPMLGNMNAFEGGTASPPPMAMKSSPQMATEDASRSRPIEPSVGEPSVQQYIAYSHNLGMRLPKGQVEAMMAGHTAACQAAGTSTCIVINSNTYSQDEDYASGNLSIRATPDWIEGFMGGIESDAEKAGGEITQRSTRADDLTRQIVDTGARLDAQKTLQGRLLNLLERRDGNLGELLQIERELARVTGEIESIEAQLKTLRLRVSMSSLDIGYETVRPTFDATRESPLGQAFGDFFYNLSSAIAAVITAFAVGLPWILLIGLFLWIWLKLIWPRLRGKKKTKA